MTGEPGVTMDPDRPVVSQPTGWGSAPGPAAKFEVARRYQSPYGDERANRGGEGFVKFYSASSPDWDALCWEDYHRAQFSRADAADWEARCVAEFLRKKQWQRPLAVSPSTANGNSIYRPLADKHEIRVFEIHPGSLGATIEGQLHHISLEFEYRPYHADEVYYLHVGNTRPTDHGVSLHDGQPVCYTALSYVWGSSDSDCSVLIDGSRKSITKSLDTAIRHLRHEDHSVVLWIDQISIDQANRAEKESQIPLMALIYKRSYTTVIWLGDEPEGRAFEALYGLQERVRYRDTDLLDGEKAYLLDPTHDGHGALQTLADLLGRPWFKRTWTIQESVLAKETYIMTGKSTMLWEDFAGACHIIAKAGFFDLASSSGSIRKERQDSGPKIDGLVVASQLYQIQLRFHGQEAKANLFSNLVETRYAQVGNPLDKVYGILGLCESKVVPDYSKPLAELFRGVSTEWIQDAVEDVARQHLAGDGDLSVRYWSLLRVLCEVDHEPGQLADLPSWAVDWSRPRLTMALGARSSTLNCYNAGRTELDNVVAISNDGCYLTLQAKVVDTIVEQGAIIANADLTADEPELHSEGLKSCIYFAQSRSMNLTGGFESFCRTIVAGKDGSGMNRYPQEYTEILSFLCDEITGQRPSFYDQVYTPRQKKGYMTLNSLRTRTTGRAFQNLEKAFRAATLNRRLCWTHKGYLGLVPRYARDGDMVVVVPGSPVPFIIRPFNSSDYQLVGECYVDGIMHGEVMDDDSIKLMDLVIA